MRKSYQRCSRSSLVKNLCKNVLTQILVIKPENSEDFDSYLRDIFNDWCAKGDIEFNLLSAFGSILRIAGYEDPKQTIQSWIRSVKEQIADALEMSISELDFLDIDLSVELDQIGLEESFFGSMHIVATKKIGE